MMNFLSINIYNTPDWVGDYGVYLVPVLAVLLVYGIVAWLFTR